MVESTKSRLERLVAESPNNDAAIADEAGRLLLELIRVEGRAERLLSRSGVDNTAVEGFHSMPLQEAARQVLARAGIPLHVRELAARVKAGGWRHRQGAGRPGQLEHQLAARLPRYPVFRRMRPNTFGLAEWGERSSMTSSGPRALFSGTDVDVARWIGDHPEAPMEDTWPSS